MKKFSLSSNSLKSQLDNKQVFNDFGLSGDNLSPHLKIENVPEDAKSFVVICHDADAPTPSGWWHWCAFNIPSSFVEFEEGGANSPDEMIETKNDFGGFGYGGACPPPGHGDHAYNFTVYAISEGHIPLDKNASPAMVMFMIKDNIVAKASLVSYFGR